MLVKFTVQNFKSFREESTLSMIASSSDKTTLEDDNVIYIDKFGIRLLKSVVIYGANASGKTKILDAMKFMKDFTVSSSKESQIDDPIPVDPFRLDNYSRKEPSVFEIVFIDNNTQYRYGFEVTKFEVVSEWLYRRLNRKEVELFYRDYQEINFHKSQFKVGDIVSNKRVRPNSLLLSVAANFNDPVAIKVVTWMKLFNVISGIDSKGYEGFSIHRMKEEAKKNEVIEFLSGADLGIKGINYNSFDLENLPDDMPEEVKEFLKKQADGREGKTSFFSDVNTLRQKYDIKKVPIDFEEMSLDKDESSGTRKYFAISGPILDTLVKGRTLVIDEIANKLHSLLTCKLVKLFNSSDTNKNNAQLIFNTHDTNLLSSGLFRRDQIYFTEKDRYGVSKIYSLADFKTDVVRKGDNFEDNYIRGKYGAIPYLGDFKMIAKEVVDGIKK